MRSAVPATCRCHHWWPPPPLAPPFHSPRTACHTAHQGTSQTLAVQPQSGQCSAQNELANRQPHVQLQTCCACRQRSHNLPAAPTQSHRNAATSLANSMLHSNTLMIQADGWQQCSKAAATERRNTPPSLLHPRQRGSLLLHHHEQLLRAGLLRLRCRKEAGSACWDGSSCCCSLCRCLGLCCRPLLGCYRLCPPLSDGRQLLLPLLNHCCILGLPLRFVLQCNRAKGIRLNCCSGAGSSAAAHMGQSSWQHTCECGVSHAARGSAGLPACKLRRMTLANTPAGCWDWVLRARQ